VGFEPIISAGERVQTYALDRAATGTGTLLQIARELYLGQRKEFQSIELFPADDAGPPPPRIALHSLPLFRSVPFCVRD
jgi:hypothetical protein